MSANSQPLHASRRRGAHPPTALRWICLLWLAGLVAWPELSKAFAAEENDVDRLPDKITLVRSNKSEESQFEDGEYHLGISGEAGKLQGNLSLGPTRDRGALTLTRLTLGDTVPLLQAPYQVSALDTTRITFQRLTAADLPEGVQMSRDSVILPMKGVAKPSYRGVKVSYLALRLLQVAPPKMKGASPTARIEVRYTVPIRPGFSHAYNKVHEGLRSGDELPIADRRVTVRAVVLAETKLGEVAWVELSPRLSDAEE